MENKEPHEATPVKIKFELNSDTAVDMATIAKNLELTNKIINDINKEVFNDNELDVKIKPFKEGSFEYEIIISKLIAVTLLVELKDLKSIITVFREIFSLYKILNNKPDSVIEHRGDKIVIENNSGTINVFNADTLKVYNNTNVPELISENFEVLKENKEIKSFQVIEDSENIFTIEKEEFNDMILDEDNIEEKTDTLNVTLSVFNTVFAIDHKWQFTFKEKRIWASITDIQFLRKIFEGEEQFSAGDTLDVKLEITKSYDKTHKIFVPKSYSILKVYDHHKLNPQERLKFNTDK